MKGTIRDDGSHCLGGYRIKSIAIRRLRPGETNYTKFAPGLRILNHPEKKTHYCENSSVSICKKPIFLSSLLLSILLLTQAVIAVPAFNNPYESGWYRVNGLAANQDYIRNSSNVLFPWWLYGYFNEADNTEWGFRYNEYNYYYLDDIRYRIIGGSYQPCSIGTFWPELKSPKVVYLPGREYVDFWGRFSFSGEPAQPGDRLNASVGDFDAGQYIVSERGWYVFRVYRDDPLTANIDGAAPGDIITFTAIEQGMGLIHSTATSGNTPIWTHHQDRVRVDINALPEPAAILLFGLGVLGVRAMGRKSGSAKFQT